MRTPPGYLEFPEVRSILGYSGFYRKDLFGHILRTQRARQQRKPIMSSQLIDETPLARRHVGLSCDITDSPVTWALTLR